MLELTVPDLYIVPMHDQRRTFNYLYFRDTNKVVKFVSSLLRNANWPRSLRCEPILIAGISSNKQAESSAAVQSEPTKSSTSSPRVDKPSINDTEPDDKSSTKSTTLRSVLHETFFSQCPLLPMLLNVFLLLLPE